MKGYPARFEREQDGRYSVYFLGNGMDGCVTYGNDSDLLSTLPHIAVSLIVELLLTQDA